MTQVYRQRSGREGAASRVVLIASLAAVCLGMTSPARATLATFITASGETTGGGPVNAEAEITTGAGTLTIKLTNLLLGNQAGSSYDVAQEISALFFTLSNAPSSTLNEDSSDTGTLRDFTSSSAFTDASGTLSRWTLTSSGANLALDVLGGGQPNQLIIGGQGSGYDVNSSVRTHDPQVAVSATFNFSAPGVSASTTVIPTSVVFRFGTTAGRDQVPGQPGTIPNPEPSTIALALSGLGAIGIVGLRRLRRRPAVAST
jgi:hypothetical protein